MDTPYETIPEMVYTPPLHIVYNGEKQHWVVKEYGRPVGYIYYNEIAGKHVLEIVSADTDTGTIEFALDTLKEVQQRRGQ